MYPPWIQVSVGMHRQYAYGWIFSPPMVMAPPEEPSVGHPPFTLNLDPSMADQGLTATTSPALTQMIIDGKAKKPVPQDAIAGEFRKVFGYGPEIDDLHVLRNVDHLNPHLGLGDFDYLIQPAAAQSVAQPVTVPTRPPLVDPWATVKDPTTTGTAAPDTSWIKPGFMSAAKPAPAPTGRPPLIYPWAKPVSDLDPLWRTELDVTRLALQWVMLIVLMGACYLAWPGPAIRGAARFLYRRRG